MKSKFTLLAAMLLSASAFAQQSVTTGGQRYSLLVEGTGAWCQHCSDGAVYVENVLAATPKAIAISEHNADGMSFAEGNVLDDSLNNGWPWGSIDMNWFSAATSISVNRGQWQAKVNERLLLTNKYDLTMTHTYNPTTKVLTVNVTGKALEALTGSFVFNVYLTEDSVVGPNGSAYSQTNATSYNTNPSHKYYNKNNGSGKIDGFQHMQVLRAMMGGTWGTAAATNPAANSSVTKTFTFTIPAQWGSPALTPKMNKLKLVGVVHKAQTGAISSTNYPEVFNSVQAKVWPWGVGVEQVSNFSEIEMFPNPATSLVAIRGLLNSPADVNVTITNTIGQVVYNKTYPKGGSFFAESISLANFNNGTYVVNVTSEGKTATEKLVVNK